VSTAAAPIPAWKVSFAASPTVELIDENIDLIVPSAFFAEGPSSAPISRYASPTLPLDATPTHSLDLDPPALRDALRTPMSALSFFLGHGDFAGMSCADVPFGGCHSRLPNFIRSPSSALRVAHHHSYFRSRLTGRSAGSCPPCATA